MLYSCQEEASPTPAASSTNAVRAAFEAAGHERALLQPFGNSAKLYWEPNWRVAYTKKTASGTEYTYIPLTPSLRAQQQNTAFRMVGTAQFIVAKHVGEAYQFYLATYTVAKPAPTPAGHKRRTLAEAAAQPVVTPAFTGKLFLKGLTVKEYALFVYENGLPIKSQASNTTARASATSATNAYECVTIYRCYWQAVCPRNGGYVTYGATTTGINSCDPPGQEACGIDNWGMNWDSNGYDTEESCTHVDDPPIPTDPGGGGNDTGNPTATTPCGALTGAGQNTAIEAQMSTLNGLVTDNKEYGFGMYYDQSGTPQFAQVVGQPGTASISISISGTLSSFTHTHYTGLLSVFSPDDMQTMWSLYSGGNMTDPSTFTMNLITASGTVYALAISDIGAFTTFGNNTFSDPNAADLFSLMYGRLYQIDPSRTVAQNELAFLQMLTQANTGLTLYRGDPNNFASWQKLTYDNNSSTISTKPCL